MGANEALGAGVRGQPEASRATSQASGRCDGSVLHVALARGYGPGSGSVDLAGLHVEVTHHLEAQLHIEEDGRLPDGAARCALPATAA